MFYAVASFIKKDVLTLSLVKIIPQETDRTRGTRWGFGWLG